MIPLIWSLRSPFCQKSHFSFCFFSEGQWTPGLIFSFFSFSFLMLWQPLYLTYWFTYLLSFFLFLFLFSVVVRWPQMSIFLNFFVCFSVWAWFSGGHLTSTVDPYYYYYYYTFNGVKQPPYLCILLVICPCPLGGCTFYV